MAHTEASEALNRPLMSLEPETSRPRAIAAERIVLAASDRLRALLHIWPQGTPAAAHRHHEATEAFFVLKGSVRFTLDRVQVVDLSAGDLLVLPRGVLHEAEATSDAHLLVVVGPNLPEHIHPAAARAGESWATDAMVHRAIHLGPESDARPRRVVLAETADMRVALHGLPAGYQMAPHRHAGDELFLPLAGQTEFDFGSGPFVAARPALVYAPEDVCHRLRSGPGGPNTLLCIVSPNNDSSQTATC